MSLKSGSILSLTILLVSSQQEDLDSRIPDLCYAPPSSGPCKGYFPKFYYDPITRTCDCFVFGGCGGNDNSFNNLSECTGNCSAIPPQIFSLACAVIFASSTDDPFAVSPSPGAGVTLPTIDDEAPEVVIRFGPDRVRPSEAAAPGSPDAKGNFSQTFYPFPPTYVHAHPPYGLHTHHYNHYVTPTLHSNFIYAAPSYPYFLPYWLLPYHHPNLRKYNLGA